MRFNYLSKWGLTMYNEFDKELRFLNENKYKCVMINTTAKHAKAFSILPRRIYGDYNISSFMINNVDILKKAITYYDGLIDYFFIDVELKQSINLYEQSKKNIKYSELITIKTNDNTIESLDLLVREKFNDDLIDKNILVIGSGNIASKTMIRFAERQSNIFVLSRNVRKTTRILKGINEILPKYNKKIQLFNKNILTQFDLVISAISTEFTKSDLIKKNINENTMFIDVGVNNFNEKFMKQLINNRNDILRLDTRIALPYQTMTKDKYVTDFFDKVMGKKDIEQSLIVAGGIIPEEGVIIVDKINNPTQIIGIADGRGGVKQVETSVEKERVYKLKNEISKKNQADV